MTIRYQCRRWLRKHLNQQSTSRFCTHFKVLQYLKFILVLSVRKICHTEVYSEPCQTSKMELLKICLTGFWTCLCMGYWQDPYWTSSTRKQKAGTVTTLLSPECEIPRVTLVGVIFLMFTFGIYDVHLDCSLVTSLFHFKFPVNIYP